MATYRENPLLGDLAKNVVERSYLRLFNSSSMMPDINKSLLMSFLRAHTDDSLEILRKDLTGIISQDPFVDSERLDLIINSVKSPYEESVDSLDFRCV